jgi:hypothetical protein
MRTDKINQVARDFVERRTRSATSDNRSGVLHNLGETAYSYREPIARHSSDEQGPCILLTSQKFSVTTSKHQSAIRRAAATAGRRVVEVDYRLGR